MNFTDNIVFEDNEDEEINFTDHPEIIINPRNYGNQSVQNLTDLKLKVHNVLNSKKEIFNEQEVKKLSDDVQKTASYNQLNKMIGSFMIPALNMRANPSNPFTCFCFNHYKDAFVIGFETGKIGMGKLSNCKTKLNPLDESNMEQKFFILDEKEIDINQPIISLNLIRNDLYILTEKRLYSCLMVSHNQLTIPKEVIKLSSLKDFKNLGVHSTIFKEKHNKIYLMSYKTERDEMFLAQIDIKLQSTYKTVKIKLDATFFEIDNNDPDYFYFIVDNVIYKMDFSFQESTFGGIFGGKTVKEGLDPNLFGASEFFRSKFVLEFVKFDFEMRNFFINEGKNIVMYSVVDFELKKLFSQPNYDPIDIFFSNEMDYLYSFHSEGQICIWDIETENLLNIFKGGDDQFSYRSPVLINEEKNLAVIHGGGIDLWQLQSPKIEKNIFEKSRYGKMHFLEDGKHFTLEFEERQFLNENVPNILRTLYLIETDTFKIIEKFKIPSNTLFYQQMMDGDLLLVLENKEYNEIKARSYKKRRLRELTDENVKNEIMFARDLKIDENIKNKNDILFDEIKNIVNSKKSFSKSQHKISSRKNFEGESNINGDYDETKVNNVVISKDEELEEKKKRAQSIMNNFNESDEDENIANYNINSVPNESNIGYMSRTSKVQNGLGYLNADSEESDRSQKEYRTESLRDAEGEYVQIKIGENLYKQPIDKEIYKYRIVKVVLELFQNKKKKPQKPDQSRPGTKTIYKQDNFFNNSDNDQGIFTLFQTDSLITSFESMLVEVEKDETKGNTDNFKRLQSKLKKNSPFAGNRNHVMVISLENNDCYRVYYKTNRASIPIRSKTVIERVFKEKMEYLDKKTKSTLKSKESYSLVSKGTNTILGQVSQMETGQITHNLDYYNNINNIKYFHDHEVIVSVGISINRTTKQKLLHVIAQKEDQPFAEISIGFDRSIKTDDSEKFDVGLIYVPKRKKKLPAYEFYIVSKIFLAVFKFDTKYNIIEFKHFMKKESSSSLPVRYSKNRKLFYIPMNHQIDIWDSSLTYFIYRIETSRPIDETILLDDQNILLIYDKNQYYELDLDELKFNKIYQNSIDTLETPRLLLDFTKLQPGQSWNVTFYTKNKHSLYAVPFIENLEMKVFPMDILLKCFLKKNYKKYIYVFAEYYYEKVKLAKRKDWVYGPLNPLLFAIYHNDSNLLEDLLDKYFYPFKIYNYVSPLEYSFAMNYRTTIKVLCDHLIKRDDFVYFSRADFKNLLRSDILTCHKLISTLLEPPGISMLPKLVYMKTNVQAIFHDYLSSLLIKIKQDDMKYTQNIDEIEQMLDIENEREFKEKKRMEQSLNNSSKNISKKNITSNKSLREIEIEIETTTRKYVENKKSDTLFKSEIDVYSVPFKYNYNIGTEDSATFVYNYSVSHSQDFILSDWKQIIRSKWRSMKIPYIILTLTYFAYMIMFTLNCTLYPTSKAITFFSFFFNIILMIFELIQMITYFAYIPGIYWRDMDNYVDWINFTFTISYTSSLLLDNSNSSKVFNVIILILVFYRGFSFLRIMDMFTSLIGMVTIIVRRLVIFFFLLLYTYLCVSFLMIKLGGSADKTLFFRDVYYWIMLGSIEDNAFEVSYSAIAIVLGSMFVTIVLLNILIAYLSNLFSRLEEQQKVQELRERAALILDMEVLVMFFKYFITGKITLRNQYEFEKYKRMLKSSSSNHAISLKDKNTTKNLKKYMSKEKYYYVFKKIDLEKGLNEENLYQKVKYLSKSVEDLNSLVLKKARSQEARIEEVRKMVKSNSNNQEKTIDDLKKLMYENSKSVSDNTENMLIKTDEQQKRIEKFLKKIEAIESQIVENNLLIQNVKDKIK